MHQAYSQLETLAFEMQKKLWKVWPRIVITRIMFCWRYHPGTTNVPKKTVETPRKFWKHVRNQLPVSVICTAYPVWSGQRPVQSESVAKPERFSQLWRQRGPSSQPGSCTVPRVGKSHSILMVQDNFIWTRETPACSPAVRLVLVLLGSESLSPKRASDTSHFYSGSY